MKTALLVIIGVVGITIGAAAGLTYTWVLAPVEYIDAAPDSLYVEEKAVYLSVIGDLYVCEGDLAQTKARLKSLGVEADGKVLAGFVEYHLNAGGRPEDVRNLAQLARDLGASGGVLQVFSSEAMVTPEANPSPSSTESGSPQPVISPTPFPTLTPAPIFRLAEQTALCATPGEPGRILVWVQDEWGVEMPGAQVVVSWAMGQDRLYTGLRPDIGVGYADFEMKSQVEYDVALVDYGGEVAQSLSSELVAGVCPTDTIAIDWRLVFQQSE